VIAAGIMVPAAGGALVLLLVRGRRAARGHLARRFVRTLQALGPTVVKFGQTASTRRDALPPQLCDAMSQLFDSVIPMSPRVRDRALAAAYGPDAELPFVTVDRRAVASGSIACVYRAVRHDGTVVALKLKRPGIDRRMAADLALLRAMVKAGERLPKMRGMPMGELVAYISIAILGQLDFRREAANLVRLRESLAELPQVRVPELIPELCRPDCLVMEFIPGLDAGVPETLPAATRATLAGAVLAAAHTMMFRDGFVHCDLHPGNVYLTRDERLVILDAGYSVQLPDKVRRLIGEFFERLPQGDGRRCGEIVLESAVHVGPQTDTEGFVAAVADLVARSAGPDVQFDMPVFGNAMFDLQRDHGLYAASDFAFPLMSLAVLEGTVNALCPELDFQQVGAPVPAPPG